MGELLGFGCLPNDLFRWKFWRGFQADFNGSRNCLILRIMKFCKLNIENSLKFQNFLIQRPSLTIFIHEVASQKHFSPILIALNPMKQTIWNLVFFKGRKAHCKNLPGSLFSQIDCTKTREFPWSPKVSLIYAKSWTHFNSKWLKFT